MLETLQDDVLACILTAMPARRLAKLSAVCQRLQSAVAAAPPEVRLGTLALSVFQRLRRRRGTRHGSVVGPLQALAIAETLPKNGDTVMIASLQKTGNAQWKYHIKLDLKFTLANDECTFTGLAHDEVVGDSTQDTQSRIGAGSWDFHSLKLQYDHNWDVKGKVYQREADEPPVKYRHRLEFKDAVCIGTTAHFKFDGTFAVAHETKRAGWAYNRGTVDWFEFKRDMLS
mmetsp:Transcript_29476/g.94321  ORF Transcript_29476/g.94321 Transcript_29476/m.94321 type:complete len:229 (+) Transcript_29476:80-766(+)